MGTAAVLAGGTLLSSAIGSRDTRRAGQQQAESAAEAAALKIKADLLKAIPPEGGLSAGQITL